MTSKDSAPSRKTSRRNLLLAGGGLAAAGALGGWKWWHGYPDLIKADAAASSEADLFERGLIGVEHSGWTKPEGPSAPWPALGEALDTDVLVVGAGLAGSSLALHLAEAGVATVLIEARQPGWGASGRNAGHVLPSLRDRSVFGSFPDQGKAFLEAFREHHTIPYDLQQRHGFEADAVRTGYLNVAEDKDEIAKFRAQTAWMESQGLLRVQEVGGAELEAQTGSKLWTHALDYVDGGHVNPYRLTSGMAAAAAKLGATVFGGTPATGIEQQGQRWLVRTPGGSIRAARVVFCTNAYPTDVVPEFTRAFYPLTAYALTTQPLSAEARAVINPGGKTLSQVPLDINPLVRDRHDKLILSSIPTVASPQDARWHFENQLAWLHHAWPETKTMRIELETYWTGRVAMRDRQFPGVFQPRPGLYGLMYFNAWGNVMAPLMGKLMAAGLAADRTDALPFPIERPLAVSNQGKMDRIIRHLLIPSARTAQNLGIL
ncbi:NAD(P)/FAD-dependent oxidoreductase [Novosphingobium sp.]|uniref:NAD(P)/FAD-dependent oxidoreductase n=1 Tax=Novosphingobium sp. TaxID=1874826 RepID=UPI0035B370CA